MEGVRKGVDGGREEGMEGEEGEGGRRGKEEEKGCLVREFSWNEREQERGC